MEDLGDFMEMVTVYKCKFCDFTTNTVQGMASHVKSIHLKNSPQVTGVQTASLPTVSSQSIVIPQLDGPNTSQNISVTIPQLDGSNTHQNILISQINESIPPENIIISQLDQSNSSQSITIPQLNESNYQPDSNVQTVSSDHDISSNIQQVETGSQENTDKPDNLSYEAGSQIVQLNGTGALQQVIVDSMSEPTNGVQILPVRNVISVDSGTDMLEDIQNTADDQFQIMKENGEGHLVAANCGHVQLGDGSTVQVLVYDSNIQQTGDLKSETGALVHEEDNSTKDPNQPMGVQQENTADEGSQLHFVINAEEQMYREPEESADTFTRLSNEQQTNPETVETSVKHEDIEQGEDSASKELYLCGSCSQGFATIQECKVHMIHEHNLNDPHSSGRVDAGTQMEPKKKVGRKKKSEQVHVETKEDEKITLSDEDEDWSEKLHSYGSRSKRKRRPPSTLTKDYYLGRSKVKSQKRMNDDPDSSPLPLVWTKNKARKCGLNGCTAKFWDQRALDIHRDCHIKDATEKGDQFRCLECEQTFELWKVARNHMWKTHDIDIDLVTCDICNDFKTDALFKLKIHRQIHGDDRPFTCSFCSKGFKQFAQMRNHEVCHSELNAAADPDQADKWHTPKVCDICGRTLANAKCLKMHIKTVHSKFKQYKCSYCPHTCARKAMLIIHQRIHTGEKPFKCDQCAYSCGDHNSLRRHKMRHTGTKPYSCPHCSYACIQAISLKVHIKNKHPGLGGVFNCHMCLFRTVNKLQYDNHMLDHKHGLIETIVNPDGQVMYKNVNHTKRPRVNTMKQEITTVALQPDMLETLQTQSVQMQNILQPQVIQIPVSTSVPVTDQVGQLQMQVQMNEAGESIISADDLAKLTNYEGMAHSDVHAAQLIYSALSAISQNSAGTPQEAANQGVVAGVENGDIQTSIQTDNSEEGVTTHTITFHLPEGEELTENVAVQSEADNKNVTILKVNDNGQDWPVNAVMLEQAEVQNT